MKLRYKKLVIIISVATLVLGFFILTLIPTGRGGNDASSASLELTDNEEIKTLIQDYFTAKKNVDMDAFTTIVSDVSQLNRAKLTAMAAYVEDYQNIECYVIEDEQNGGCRVYVKYDLKMKNIDTLAPSLSAFYLTNTSDNKYVIYLSALDEVQEDFINSADENEAIVNLENDVQKAMNDAINSDPVFKQLYQRMDQGIRSVSGSAVSGSVAGVATGTAAGA